MIVTVCAVVRGLRKMQHQQAAQAPSSVPDQLVVKATRLVLATVVAFIVCLIPPLLTETYFFVSSALSKDREAILRLRTRMIFDSYAIINVLIFGVMT